MTPRPLTVLPFVVLFLFALASAGADVLTTTNGLVLEGDVQRGSDGSYVLRTSQGEVAFPADRVAQVVDGEGPRARLQRQAGALASDDAEGWFRLALKAEAAGLGDTAREAHRRVIQSRPDHAASRRALGHEQVDGTWVEAAVARRKQGLVLYEGRWMLPAEVELTARETEVTIETPVDVANTRILIRTFATADEPVLSAARLALAGTPRERRLKAARQMLYDGDVRLRQTSARLLGEMGDESALRALIFSGARDTDAEVRREAVLAAASLGHDDTAVPFVRALWSPNPRLVANAAEALGTLGDPRAVTYLIKRIRSHGSSTRNFVSFINQVSYVRDYDVEIAQASNIANPDVGVIQDGVVLDVKVLDAGFEKTYVERVLVGAVSKITKQPLRSRRDVMAWYAEHEDELPEFPEKPGARAERRKRGTVIGVPMTR